ncbi:peptidyl-tRNA hydrolase-domain-containing protein [Exophiala viscosa]|uniref:peptidyl-tRNA hydrolase-domain-containing protein n=1 Tax=Exophiala viscosa TaxID=2486360 RepID=UPI00219D0E7F|nr:peptidyl-tRNA hydrolase-domain-containing protein [Exophiala viscosa]
MTNSARRGQNRRGHARQHSQHNFAEYHDDEQDSHWSEPVDEYSLTTSASHLDPIPQPSRKNVISRRPVNPVISTEPPPFTNHDSEPPTSPIIPSPLRIRKPKTVTPVMAARSVRLLVASIGNPPPYHTTRHSAGHLLLKTIAANLSLPPLSKGKALGSGSVSVGFDRGSPEYTLWQSAAVMNVSGAPTLKAWKQFTNIHPASADVVTALVVLHDELESPIGTIKLRRGETSAKGHNGIKSIQSSLKSAGLLPAMGERFIKIGIGIGRPQSRETNDVSAWVLGQLTQMEKGKMEAATDSVIAVLRSEISRLENA